MDAKIPGMQLPTGATVDITPFVARQNVNVFVKREISTQLGAAEPNLLVGERPCWSVPVVLSFPDRGIVGKVGEPFWSMRRPGGTPRGSGYDSEDEP